MLDDFIIRAGLGGIGLALAAGPLGSFVIWRRMAFLGEALANAALLGVVLALLLHLHLLFGVLALLLLAAMLLLLLERQDLLPMDTLLSIVAHGVLAIGLLALGGMSGVRIDLMSLLLGDILATSRVDLTVIAVVVVLNGCGLALLWRPLLSATVHADLAAVEGVPVGRMRLLLTLMLASVIAVGMKVVGILLIVSLLVVPAAAARHLARTPEAMALLAALVGVVAVTCGLMLSLHFDLPAGPAITASAVAVFTVVAVSRSLAGVCGRLAQRG